MIRLVTIEEMKQIEIQADQSGWSYTQMMERAGQGLAEEVQDMYGGLFLQPADAHVSALIGTGNNGGDTLIALTFLHEWGWNVSAYLMGRSPTDSLVRRFEKTGGEIFSTDGTGWETRIEEADIIIDGILGTGFKLPLHQELAQKMALIAQVIQQSEQKPYIVAVDCPSGVDCNSGEMAVETLQADLTVCMAAVKSGLLKLPAYEKVGGIALVEIGLSEDLPAWQAIKTFVVDEASVRDWLPKRPLDAHKGTFGTALIVGGSVNYTGAPLLAAKAAYRVGAGLVTMGVPEALHAPLAGAIPEATWLLLAQETGVIAQDAAEVVLKQISRSSSVLIGPGMGIEETTQNFVADLFRHRGPYTRGGMGFVSLNLKTVPADELSFPAMVIDADGLKHLARIPDWSHILPDLSVVTPHPGEMAVLTGLKIEDIQNRRLEVAREYAAQWQKIVVLKGAFTVIAHPQGEALVIPVASPALARAGTGDVLAGMIVGFLAQGMEPFHAAAAACWIHAQAGLLAMDQMGTSAAVLAGDVLAAVPEVLADLIE